LKKFSILKNFRIYFDRLVGVLIASVNVVAFDLFSNREVNAADII